MGLVCLLSSGRQSATSHILAVYRHYYFRMALACDRPICVCCVQMVLHYYLADDTVEIREVFPANAGRDSVPTFLRRGRLPKVVESLKRPGELADRTVLNVFGPMGKGGRYILDSLKVCLQYVHKLSE